MAGEVAMDREPEQSTSTKPARRFQFSLRMLLIVVTIVAAISGFFRWRWLNSPELVLARQRAEFTERFKSVPLKLGSWVGQDVEIRPIFLEAYECRGAAQRGYKNGRTGAEMNFVVIQGPPGPTSVNHTSASRIYSSEKSKVIEMKRHTLGLEPVVESIKTTKIEKENGEQCFDLISFSPAGVWSAPDIPRIEFGGEKELTKLELTYSNPTKSSPENELELEETVVLLFPHLQQALFPPSKSVMGSGWLADSSLPLPQLVVTTLSLLGLLYLGLRHKRAVG